MIRYGYMLLALFILLVLPACASNYKEQKASNSTNKIKAPTSFEQLTFKSEGRTVFEDEGKFILIEGSKCVQHDSGEETATVLQWIELPSYVDRGTVVLNGWDLRFLHGDREVNSMLADITHSKVIKSEGSTFLVFEAQGRLNDQNRKDAYEFCVFYSGFGFRSVFFDATIEDDYNGVEVSTLQDKNQGALATLENTGSRGTLKGNATIAIIPRGFDFQFDDTFECEWRFPPCKWGDRVDYRLLQAAYSLSQSGMFPSLDGSPHWAVQTLFKDNSTRTYRIKARAAMIRGTSVKLRADFLALNSRTGKTDICRKNVDGIVRTQTFRIRDLPFDYAVPLLTGWDLSYECEQQQVQRAGIWLHDIHFDSNSRSLEYKVSSILRDKDGVPSFSVAQRITVLGLNQTRTSVQSNRAPVNIKIREH
ncbi:hypothetical protein [Nitrosomonas ureae]|uniref:Lipoprotein n=1 Tax=Nitrosomonas ureae TaxID=44577 RepID=A0A0S3AJ58_9PROT|nr:hypothetical protein [Nitrosomonas ureae]ALQ51072.1 hypothetical protein ATY38_07430 [Nitrosomonas ureae]PTQ85076.1 hypothetical protein C8R28_101528 [Nitrosomonas ureae]SDU07758.1 hypothetical protein SAMN05216406_12220 [Nitrosomonas ureae]SEQ26461.1 hypothetical protein SAMN05421510_103235 [Nitrosomonas ureae]